ncbi:MAG: chromate resistance protein [Deltaproteobacteria bacterium]|nr:chromate resistance protein [Deltaproteobacteria bacterium]MBW2318017.1 chromate resistance protein [Deltaproteobacteria bacterium]
MKWITRSHVHVDRVACPWLITRFIDSDAEFLFVPKSKVMEVAEKEGAIPFDTPGAELHHRDEMCTFDVFIKDYELTDKALLRMAKVVNAADTDRLDNDPIAAGLEAIAVGYGLRFPDDTENLAGQLEVYDALYAWCRLQVARK